VSPFHSEPFLFLSHIHSHAVRVSPQFSNRMIEASRSILNRYIPDIYLYSDVYKGDESGKWVVLWPSTFLRILMTMQHLQIAWICPDTPRRVNYIWNTLCRGYFRSGSCTRRHWAQGYTSPSGRDRKGRMCWPEASILGVTYDGSRERGCRSMSYGWTDTQDVRSLVYLLTTSSHILVRIQFLRDVRAFFGTSFKIVSAEPSNPDCSQLLYSCYGTGFVNANRTLA
jgi:RNA 3'-terminal phosphate cyclase-like protein